MPGRERLAQAQGNLAMKRDIFGTEPTSQEEKAMTEPQHQDLAEYLRHSSNDDIRWAGGMYLYQLDVMDAVGPSQRFYGAMGGPGQPHVLQQGNLVKTETVKRPELWGPEVAIILHHVWWYDADEWSEPSGHADPSDLFREIAAAVQRAPHRPVIETGAREPGAADESPARAVAASDSGGDDRVIITLPPGPRPKRLSIDIEF